MATQTVKQESKFYSAADVAKVMETSTSTAYRIIKQLNLELKQQGKITSPGKIPKKFFEEKVYL